MGRHLPFFAQVMEHLLGSAPAKAMHFRVEFRVNVGELTAFVLGMKRPIYPIISFAAIMALLFAKAAHAADLRPETVSAWEEYIRDKDAAVKLFAAVPWVTDDNRLDCAILKSGKIPIAPAEPNIPKRVPDGLSHDWIGTAFIPNTTISQVLAAVRDYDRDKHV